MSRLSPPEGDRVEVADELELRVAGAESNVATAAARLWSDSVRTAKLGDSPLGRFRTPGEAVDTALFLASERSRFSTGEDPVPDGVLTSSLPMSFINDLSESDEQPTTE